MFVFTPFVIFAFTAVGRVVSETYKKGHKAVLSPGSVSAPITSISWKHGRDIAVEWYGQNKTEYRDFKGRCEVNTNTGALTITNLSVKDSGSYTAEINSKIMKTTEIKVITPVPKPTIKKQCNSEVTQCTLTCDASITADMGTITYSWKAGDSQIQAESPSNQLNITKNNTESVGKLISCQLENPVSSERSDDIMSPFTNTSLCLTAETVTECVLIKESSVGGTAAAVVIVLLIVASLIVLVCWHKRRSGNADQSWGQYLSRFNPRNCLNCERSRGTQRSTNGAETGRDYHTVLTQVRDLESVSQEPRNEVETSAVAPNAENHPTITTSRRTRQQRSKAEDQRSPPPL